MSDRRILTFPLANAFSTSATIFEVLSETDTKFAKLVDKEYDGVSGDVKKWFKKLAVCVCFFVPRYHSNRFLERRKGP